VPGGYEDAATAAVREVAEETGWRPRGIEFVLSCQPWAADERVTGV
jgi:8-oxo-dGTP pyrophosphatase MutT (NUDIX family)